VGLLALQFVWTRDSEEALTNCVFDKKVMQTTNQQFLEMLNMLISQTTLDLNKIDTIRFETLITIHVHQRDIFDDLVMCPPATQFILAAKNKQNPIRVSARLLESLLSRIQKKFTFAF